MPSSRTKRGFTLIELLIVVVIIGVLASIAIPKFQSAKGKSYAAALRSDLKNLSVSQEDYFYNNANYSTSIGDLSFSPTTGVTLTITEATGAGWSATATHPLATPQTCAVYYGNAAQVAPATAQSQVTCQ
ncbi:MAG TPA: prepilin-type N-terminal cleavage/methylation domain-containing protein [Gemmatimonas sp.]|nr:prepilin-type N-terminal cleavage/methylation domain-containing protein [Gemmatimonas sp.]